jgi:myo-inositol-1(or 4)-monophosphatase
MNLDKILSDVCGIAKEAGQFLITENKNIKQSDIESKSEHDFVTYVDKASEKFLIAELSKILPEAGFMAEESMTERSNVRFCWIVDPLDGTSNYIHGLAPYAVSIALTDNNNEILGVIFEPNLNECFSAHIQSAAFLNDKPMKVSETKKMDNAFLATGFPSRDYSRMDAYMQLFRHLMANTQSIRRLGSAAIDMAYVACGRFDAFYEYGLYAWDVAAASLLVKQAGGRVTDFSGGKDYLFGKELVCSNELIQEELLEIIARFFKK